MQVSEIVAVGVDAAAEAAVALGADSNRAVTPCRWVAVDDDEAGGHIRHWARHFAENIQSDHNTYAMASQ